MKLIYSASFLGALLAFIALVGGVGVDAAIQHLLQTYGFFQIVFLNNFFALVVMGSVMGIQFLYRQWNRKPRTMDEANKNLSENPSSPPSWLPKRWQPHLILGGMGVAGELLFFWGLREHSLAENYTLVLATPLLVVFLGVLFYRERIRILKWCCIATGFGASVLALNPNLTEFSLPLLGVLGVTCLNAWSYWVIKHHAAEEGMLALLLTSRCCSLVVALMMMLGFQTWQPLSPSALLLLLGNGLGYYLMFILLIIAIRMANVSTISFMEYSQLFMGVLVDYVLYTIWPSLITIISSILILGAGMIIVVNDWLEESAQLPASSK